MSQNWINPKRLVPAVADFYRRAKSGVEAKGEHLSKNSETILRINKRIDEQMDQKTLVEAGSHVDNDPSTEDTIVFYDNFSKGGYNRRVTLVERQEEDRQVIIGQVEQYGGTFTQKIDAATTELLEESDQKLAELGLYRSDIFPFDRTSASFRIQPGCRS